jgi:hypothetical protein
MLRAIMAGGLLAALLAFLGNSGLALGATAELRGSGALGRAPGQASGALVVCPRLSSPPTLEGRLDDWPVLPQVVLASAEDWRPAAPQFSEYGGPDDVSGELWLGWDSSALYLALQVRDNLLVRARSIADIDQGDSVVLSFAGGEPQTMNEFVVALLKSGYPAFRAKPADRRGELRTISVGIDASQEEAGVRRIVYEIGIPWSELAPLRPSSGARFTLTISLCDDDGAGMKGCLERALAVALSAAGEPVRPSPAEVPTVPALPPAFSAPEMARFDRNCFVFGGQDKLLFGGEMEYSRIPSADWPQRVAALKAAGLNLVGVTVPWSYHQPTSRGADLTVLRDFLSLCARDGLLVQLSVGPYAGERWEGGGVPEWVFGLPSDGQRSSAIESWYESLLALVKEQQVTVGGPVAVVLIRPLPDRNGRVDAASLERLLAVASRSGITVPVLTANAPAARNNSRQVLANLLDTLAFYSPPTSEDVIVGLRALAREENGPPVISALAGSYTSPQAARRSADLVKLALAGGATDIVLDPFASGINPSAPLAPDTEVGLGPALSAVAGAPPASRARAGEGAVDAAGTYTAGYDEMRLVGAFLSQFGPRLARAALQEGAAKTDDPEAAAAVRTGSPALSGVEGAGSFWFIWDTRGTSNHSLRLTVTDPTTGTPTLVPEAGAITLPPGGAKMLVADLPIGRGLLRYSTSEVLGTYQVGERVVLVVYGDPDTPGEIALQWPGPPLVTGQLTRQRWDPDTRTLVLDYYHGVEDRYLLVDELQIAVLPRARAARVAALSGPDGQILLSAGIRITAAGPGERMLATLDCPAGPVQVTGVLPGKPSAVLLDGKPVDFQFSTPERVLSFSTVTPSFEEEHRSSSVWDRLGRVVVGGPPRLHAEFDRAWFMLDDPRSDGWKAVDSLEKAVEQLGIATGDFVRFRSRYDPGGRSRMVVKGSPDPALVFVNGQFIAALSGTAPEREADLSGALVQGENEVVIVLHLLTRPRGLEGALGGPRRLPTVTMVGDGEPLVLTSWEVSTQLEGEQAGWNRDEHELSDWHFVHFGPWRRQGKELAGAAGVGWYRVPFALPQPGAWRIPYQVKLDITGAAVLWLDGRPLATCGDEGRYTIPVPEALVRPGENTLAAAVYGFSDATGLRRVEVAADESRMMKQRTLEIRF